jgi:hypothetical protein
MPDVVAAIGARHPDVPDSIPDYPDRSKAAGSPLILCGGEIVVAMAALPAQLPFDAGIISVASHGPTPPRLSIATAPTRSSRSWDRPRTGARRRVRSPLWSAVC